MKRAIFLWFLICCTAVYGLAQTQELRLRLNQVSVFKNTEDVFTDDVELFTTPREEDTGRSFDLDLTWFKPITGKNRMFFRVGYSEGNQTDFLTQVRDTFYVAATRQENSRAVLLAAGIGHVVRFDESNFELNANLAGLFRYSYNSSTTFENEFFNQSDVYFSGTETVFSRPNSTRVGVSFEVGGLYYLMGKIGLGLEVYSGLYWDRLNGTTVEDRFDYDSNRTVTESLHIEHVETRNKLGKNFGFSLALAYKL